MPSTRFYLTPIVTDAVGDGVETRPKVARTPALNWTAIYPATSGAFVLVMVEGEEDQHLALNADSENDQFPPLDYDQPFSAVMSSNQFNNVIRRMQNRGIDTTGLTVNSLLIDGLMRVCGVLQPGMPPGHVRNMRVGR